MEKEPVEIKEMSVSYSLGATVTINGNNWVKPGVVSGLKWNGVPTEEELRGATKMLLEGVVEPLMEDLIAQVVEQAAKADGMLP